MRVLELKAKTGASTIMLGESIANLPKHCGQGKVAIVTDSAVRALHGSLFPEGVPVIEIGRGEGSKTLQTVHEIYERLLELELERDSCLVGIGGGIVCDVAGFAATTYLRGIGLGLVPTTLLAQVDAGVGGKNGVNLNGYKNIVGTIRQPDFVLCDFELLRTLPKSEMRNGLAEAVKHAAIGDGALFSYLEEHGQEAEALKRTAIEKVVYESLLVKSRIVASDESEKAERRKLNFGHTIGHALEKTAGLPHGQAVAAGMAAAARLSVARGVLQRKEGERLEQLLLEMGLRTSIAYDSEKVMDAIGKDKKRDGDEVNFVLLEAIGKAKVEKIGIEEIRGVVDDMCEHS